MRLVLAQIDPTVGDLEGNAARVIDAVREARRLGADVVAFPELVLSGYPPEDLLLKDHFLRGCERALEQVAAACHGLVAVVGVPVLEADGGVANAAAVLAEGSVRAVYHKIRLPNYAVFDEERYFTPGRRVLVVQSPHCADGRERVRRHLAARRTHRRSGDPGRGGPDHQHLHVALPHGQG